MSFSSKGGGGVVRFVAALELRPSFCAIRNHSETLGCSVFIITSDELARLLLVLVIVVVVIVLVVVFPLCPIDFGG